MADELWTGAVSPLMYTVRAPAWVGAHQNAAGMWVELDVVEHEATPSRASAPHAERSPVPSGSSSDFTRSDE
jgi:hypothetical protein